MNYLKQLIQFHHRRKIYPLNKNAGWLYIVLLEYANDLFFIPWFTAANGTLQGNSGLSRKQLDDARNELKTKGYIDYKKASGNKAGRYLLVEFDTQTDTQLDTQIDTQTEHNMGTLYKHKQNKTKDKSNTNVLPKEPRPRFQKPTIEEIAGYCKERGNGIDPNRFYDYYESNGWKVGKNSMKNWKATVRNWETRQEKSQGGQHGGFERDTKPEPETELIIR